MKRSKPKSLKKISKVSQEKTYKSFEQWKKDNFPNLSRIEEEDFSQTKKNSDPAKTLKKLNNDSGFELLF